MNINRLVIEIAEQERMIHLFSVRKWRHKRVRKNPTIGKRIKTGLSVCSGFCD
jgi:hypothetical protein